jgi:hypothetical protein
MDNRISKELPLQSRSLGARFFGALTTAVGFLALVLSGAMSFAQLGVLIAMHFRGGTVHVLHPLSVRSRTGAASRTRLAVRDRQKIRAPNGAQTGPRAGLCGAVFLLLSAIGFSPVPPLHFEASARSLQPKNIHAGHALDEIMQKMPVRWEPVLAIVRGANPQELHDYWQKISADWRQLQAAGKIKSFSTPAALCLSPRRMQENRVRLSTVNFQAARETLEQTLDAEGFNRDAFAQPSRYLIICSGMAIQLSLARLAQPVAANIELVVFGGPLLWTGSLAHNRIRHDQPASGDACAKRGASP